jgi:membrane-associated phospholipid phosphatase
LPKRKPKPLKRVERGDLALARAVALDPRSAAGQAVARFAELGDQPPLRILCAAVVAAGLAGSNRRLLRTGVRMALAHSLATLTKSFVKDDVDRTRPAKALADHHRLKPGRSRDHALQSMPSGHSAGVVAVAAAVIAEYPKAALPVAAASAAVLGAQLPSRNHFLSDVAAGSAIGIAGFALARWLLPPIDRDQP